MNCIISLFHFFIFTLKAYQGYGGYPYGGECCNNGGYGTGYGAAIILVLFILLVIVIGARAFTPGPGPR